MKKSPSKVKVFKSGNAFCIWDKNEIDILIQHKICGYYNTPLSIHNNPKKEKNQQRVSLPFVINMYECKMGYEMDILTFYEYNNVMHKDKFVSFSEENNKLRIKELQHKLLMKQNNIGKRKLNQLNNIETPPKKKIKLNEDIKNNDNSDITALDSVNNIDLVSGTLDVDKHKIQTSQTLIEILGSDCNNQGIKVQPCQDHVLLPHNEINMDDSKDDSIWMKLLCLNESEYKAFNEYYTFYKRFYESGFYVRIDSKFCGNFIIYTDNPYKKDIHGKYIVIILDRITNDGNNGTIWDILTKYSKLNENETKKLLDLDIRIMSNARCCVNANKTLMYARMNNDGKPEFFVIEWNKTENNNDKNLKYYNIKSWFLPK